MPAAWNQFVRRLEITLRPEEWSTVSDGRLLEQFRNTRDHGAFAELVRRHGPMVMGVCHRVLRQAHDAEDAFQAAFLVLVRKAPTLRSSDNVAGWLHGVAYRTAMKARSMAARRHGREQESEAVLDAVARTEGGVDREEMALLDDEVRRLPEKYRLPIVLCDLEGHSRSHAAKALRWPEGTVAGRLIRARQLLARRLSRRGVGVSVGMLPTLLAIPASQALSTSLVCSTVHVASLTLLGPGTAPLAVQQLTQGVLTNMTVSKCKMIALSLVGVLMVGVGINRYGPAFAEDGTRRPKVAVAKSSPPDIEPIDPELLFRKEVQQELRLSQAQINKFVDAYAKGRDKKDNLEEQRRLDREIAELNERLNKLQERKNALVSDVVKSQHAEVKKIIPETLSSGAIKRLQELSVQSIGLHTLMADPKFIAQLGLTDDQLKKWEESSKTLGFSSTNLIRFSPDGVYLFDSKARLASQYQYSVLLAGGNAESFVQMLTPEQKKKWEAMQGKPLPEQAPVSK